MNGETSVSPEAVSNDVRFSQTSQLLFLVSPFLNEIEYQLNCYSSDGQKNPQTRTDDICKRFETQLIKTCIAVMQ